MKLDTAFRMYQLLKATGDLAWHLGFRIGRLTKKRR